ncbi:hypothetical protein Cni_G17359 [Canna indica]|uniref:Transposase n=1 Tax=Canna indica TaxID=4628 RepID=A0AAQ3KMJ0_9LILI|nr:hypothetical protein Cni_G17359 [Canna indica]
MTEKKEPSDESEYEPSDHLDTASESKNKQGNKKKRKKQKFATFNKKTDFHGRVELTVGMCFNDFKVCKSAVKKYAVQRGIDFVFIKNEKKKDNHCMQEGLWMEVLEELGADHRICIRHLYANFKKSHPSKILNDELWNAARATIFNSFKACMKRIKNIDQSAYDWLMRKPPRKWTRHTFRERTKSDMLLNNNAEIFNGFILETRDKPILTMCEMIRRMLMKRLVAKKKSMINYLGPITPRVQLKLESAKKDAPLSIIACCGNLLFEANHVRDGQKVVDLK